MLKHRLLTGFTVLGLAFCWHAFATAQEEKGTESRTREKRTSSEGRAVSAKTFVKKASRSGVEEVRFGKLAEERATNPEVRKFAQHMVKDHTRANKELLSLAEQKGFMPTKTMDLRHRAMAEKLSRMEGASFDRQYMHGQVRDHEEAVALFEGYAQNGEDRDLKAFAAKTLPTLQEHLRMARDITAKVGGGSRTGTGTGTGTRTRTGTGNGTERNRER